MGNVIIQILDLMKQLVEGVIIFLNSFFKEMSDDNRLYSVIWGAVMVIMVALIINVSSCSMAETKTEYEAKTEQVALENERLKIENDFKLAKIKEGYRVDTVTVTKVKTEVKRDTIRIKETVYETKK